MVHDDPGEHTSYALLQAAATQARDRRLRERKSLPRTRLEVPHSREEVAQVLEEGAGEEGDHATQSRTHGRDPACAATKGNQWRAMQCDVDIVDIPDSAK